MGSKKMYRPKYSMFFDLHAMQECHDVWHAFDAEKFAEQLHNAAGRTANSCSMSGFPATIWSSWSEKVIESQYLIDKPLIPACKGSESEV